MCIRDRVVTVILTTSFLLLLPQNPDVCLKDRDYYITVKLDIPHHLTNCVAELFHFTQYLWKKLHISAYLTRCVCVCVCVCVLGGLLLVCPVYQWEWEKTYMYSERTYVSEDADFTTQTKHWETRIGPTFQEHRRCRHDLCPDLWPFPCKLVASTHPQDRRGPRVEAVQTCQDGLCMILKSCYSPCRSNNHGRTSHGPSPCIYTSQRQLSYTF